MRTRIVAVLAGAALVCTGALPAAAHPGHEHEPTDPPPAGNFQKVSLVDEVAQPMQLTVANDRRVFFIERSGSVRIWKPDTGATVEAGGINVDTRGESGLQGLALDPDFDENGWIYVYYSSIEHQDKRLSRFHMTGDSLDFDSEVVLLTAPTDFPARPSHVGGSIDFDLDGNLILSTGDDTQPYESDGYAPLDDRPGRTEFDSRRTSGNTNDLRGKLLRITPTDTAEGGYTIPEGNLFAPGTEKTRPEIYAMGLRNPFRIGVDPYSGAFLVADYGPDARTANPDRGPEGYVEWQVIEEPGNFGWPFCHGPNLPYNDYDFETGVSGPKFDCDAPINDSAFNTGLRELPPVVAPAVAYNNMGNADYPELGASGGLAPMAGPVYKFDPELDSERKFPEYYDGKAFFYEWSRYFLATIDFDGNEPPSAITRFLPDETFNAPMDMVFGPDGAMYLAEWGRGFGRNNPDDGIYRIEYAIPGERAPVARAAATPNNGSSPLEVRFSSEGSSDPDEGQVLSFSWDFGDGATSAEAHPTHTYDEPGVYQAQLTATDDTGRSGTVNVRVVVGNTAPTVTIEAPVDGGFIDAGETVRYRVSVTDPEDGEIDCDRVVVQPAIGHDAHGHPTEELRGCEGEYQTDAGGHGADANMFYVLSASYTDDGTDDLPALTATDDIMLHPKHRQAEHYSSQSGTSENRSDAFAEGAYRISSIATGDWIAFDRMNVQGIDEISYRVAGTGTGTIEMRAGAPDGPVIASTTVEATGGGDVYVDTAPAAVSAYEGTHTMYFVFTASANNAFNVDRLTFIGNGVAAMPTPVETTVQTRCIAGKAYVAVRAENISEDVHDIGISTTYGSRSFTAVAPGASAYQLFTTRQATVPSGTVTVTVDGEEYETALPAHSCR